LEHSLKKLFSTLMWGFWGAIRFRINKSLIKLRLVILIKTKSHQTQQMRSPRVSSPVSEVPILEQD
jgi:hypothetical protein